MLVLKLSVGDKAVSGFLLEIQPFGLRVPAPSRRPGMPRLGGVYCWARATRGKIAIAVPTTSAIDAVVNRLIKTGRTIKIVIKNN